MSDPPKVIVGSGGNTSTILTAAPIRKYSDLFVSRFNPQATVYLLKSELFSEFEDITVTQLETKHSKYAPFHIHLSLNKLNDLLESSFWPDGVIVRRFWGRLQLDIILNGNSKKLNSQDVQLSLGFYQNCRGLRSKLSCLKCNVALFNYIFICLTEPWLCDSFYDNELGLSNYAVFRCYRNSFTSNFSRSGSALIAIRNDVVCELLPTIVKMLNIYLLNFL